MQNGTVEIGQTGAYYYVGKDVTFTFDTAVPFGLNSRQHEAWWMHGGGRQLMDEFYKDYDVVGHLMGGTGAQMGGWYRKEIKTPEDLRGLKFRVGGFAGQILSKLGVMPSSSPAATSIRRWRRARSTPPNGSVPTTTRSSASTRWRRTTTIPAGGKAPAWARPTST